jgi:hypothetical protein
MLNWVIQTMTTELHKVNIHLIQYIYTHIHTHTVVHQSKHKKKVNKLLVEMTPQLKFKVPSSNLDVVDLSQFLKDNTTDKLIGQHTFLEVSPNLHPR